MGATFHIGQGPITLSDLKIILTPGCSLQLADEAVQRIQTCRDYLDNKLKTSDELFYGINTGFGSLCNVHISKDQIEQLQENLVVSHACGMGDEVPKDIVKLMIVLKLQALAQGHSGISVAACQRLIDLFNAGALPVIYQQGSLGASGDLAPLAHMALPMLGFGEVNMQGSTLSGMEALKQLKLQPLRLKAKEGLALLNGTQFMAAYGAYMLLEAEKLCDQADMCGAVSVDGFQARIAPFHEAIHRIRPFAGQIRSAGNVRNWLEGSEIIASPKEHVQDPYSFRCIPQVHGASRDAIRQVREVIETEINAVTDNPIIVAEEDLILSGGNFHGQPLAIALDHLALALAELASISERRIYQLVHGLRGLPNFLIDGSGLNSGLMIPQYTAASIVSQNKQYCSPASVDTITSSAGQEDHVSMGANAATKCYKVMVNVSKVLAIELLTAMQALDFRAPLKSSPKIEALKAAFRKEVSFNTVDRELYVDMQKALQFLQAHKY